jgi:UDP-glucose 4-epimerase
VLDRIELVCGQKVPFIQLDLYKEHARLAALFMGTAKETDNTKASSCITEQNTEISAEKLESVQLDRVTGIIHCAGLKAVGESALEPIRYYENNVIGTLHLLRAVDTRLKKMPNEKISFIFSSTAMVYGEVARVPIDEEMPCVPTSPYGQTKLAVESLLKDYAESILRYASTKQCQPRFHVISLRYFNPVGAHPSGLLGEQPQGIPNNLFPFLGRVASGTLPLLNIFGDDYRDSPDGTGVRDYIHIMDLVEGHIDALAYLALQMTNLELKVPKNSYLKEDFQKEEAVLLSSNQETKVVIVAQAINLGLGRGYSVLQMVRAFEEAANLRIPYKVIQQ